MAPCDAMKLRREISDFCICRGLEAEALNDFWPGMNEQKLIHSLAGPLEEICAFAHTSESITIMDAGTPEVNGTFIPTGQFRIGKPVYRSDKGLYLFQYTMPSWRNVYWYISWLASLDALESPPSEIRAQYRDF